MNQWQSIKELIFDEKAKTGEVQSHQSGHSILLSDLGETFRAIGTSVSVGDKALTVDGKVICKIVSTYSTDIIWV